MPSIRVRAKALLHFCLHSCFAAGLFWSTAFAAQASTTTPGLIGGKFSINGSGAARYSISLLVPPGIHGMTPAIGLSYDSRQGDAAAGYGWALSGFSAIIRCGQTLADDGTVRAVEGDSDDRFCLDGQKLRAISGSYGANGAEYRKVLDDFSKVISHTTGGDGGVPDSGPQYFTVQTPDGTTYYCGNSTDSQVLFQGTNIIRVWALNKVVDASGNYEIFSYTNDATTGDYQPKEVDYTGNSGTAPGHQITFSYADLPPDQQTARYVAGHVIKQTKLLTQISISYGSVLLHYDLAYSSSNTHRSRLSTITECAGGDAPECFPATTIGWQSGSVSWGGGTNTTASTGSLPSAAHLLDLNGDGRTDLVYPGSQDWMIMLAKAGGGFSAPINTGRAIDTWPGGYASVVRYRGDGRDDLLAYNFNTREWVIFELDSAGTGFNIISTTTSADGKSVRAADYNGDGRDDLIWDDNGTYSIYVALNTGSGFGAPAKVTNGSSDDAYGVPTGDDTAGGESASMDIQADFDGDGRTDQIAKLTVIDTSSSTSSPSPSLSSSTTTAFGDSIQPAVCDTCTYPTAYHYWDALKATSNGYESIGTLLICSAPANQSCTNQYGYPLLLDANGDGLTDIVFGPWLYLSTGSGLSAVALDLGTGCDAKSATIVGGRQAVLAKCSDGSWKLARYANGQSYVSAISLPAMADTLTADLDGDGLQDFIWAGDDNDWHYALHNGDEPDLVTEITDGLGNYDNVSYESLTNSTAYTPGSGATYPTVNVRVPMYVVTSHSANDGIGGSYTETYTYADGRADMKGRGFLGFATRTAKDSRNGVLVTTHYRQDFPYIGDISETAVQQPSGTTISDETDSWDATLGGAATDCANYCFVHLTTSVQKSYEVGGPDDGSLIKTVTTTNQFDNYGNLTDKNVTTAGGGKTFVSDTNTTYEDDTANWCLAQPTDVTLTNTVPYQAGSQNRETSYVVDGSHCRVTRETVGPGDANLEVVIDYSQFNAAGEPESATVTGDGMAGRKTVTSYQRPDGVDDGSYPTSVTNPLNQTSYAGWDEGLGVQTSATDVNGNVTSWGYDGFGRKTGETTPAGAISKWTWQWCQSGCGVAHGSYEILSDTTDSSGSQHAQQSLTVYDQKGRPVREEVLRLGGRYAIVDTQYDKFGRVSKKSQPYYSGATVNWTTTTYDLIDRPLSVTQPNGATTGFAYSVLDTDITDANSHTTTKTRDALGEIAAVTDANGHTTNYEYDWFGNVTKITDPAGNQTTADYDKRGHKTSMTDPDMGHWTYSYDPLGELVSQTDAKGQTVAQTYDALGRIATRTEPQPDGSSGTTTWTYDTAANGIGLIAKVVGPDGFEKDYTYDNFSRPADETTLIDGTPHTVSKTYDVFGRVASVSYPAGIAPAADTTPTADAGPDQTVVINSTVTLNGSGSDPDSGQTLTYRWEESDSSVPVELSGEHAAQASFTPTTPGIYAFTLYVGDGIYSGSDSTSVTATPPAPSGVSGPSGTNTSGNFRIQWNIAAGAADYQVYQEYSTGGFSYYKTTTDTYVDLTNAGNGDWSYYVKACARTDNTLCSGASATVKVHVARPPSAPTNVSIPSQAVGPQNGATITVGWGAPTTGTVTDYIVYYSPSSTATDSTASKVDTGSATATSQQITLTADDTKYYIWVSACNELPTNCADSGKVATTVYLQPGAPTISSVPSYSTGHYQITWTKSSTGTTTGYTVLQAVNGGGYSNVGGDGNCTVSGASLTCDHYSDKTTYHYRIYANNGPAQSSSYASASVPIYLIPAVPGSFTVAAKSYANGYVNMSWSGVAYATNYQIQDGEYDAETHTDRWLVIHTVGNVTSTNIHESDGTYVFRIRACNTEIPDVCGGWSGASASSQVLNAPASVSLSTSATTVNSGVSYTISWTAASGTTNYSLEQSTSSSFSSGNNWYSMGTARSKAFSHTNDGSVRLNIYYYYRVRACKDWACSAFSNTVAVDVKASYSGGGGCDPTCPRTVEPAPTSSGTPISTDTSSDGSGGLTLNDRRYRLPLSAAGEGWGEGANQARLQTVAYHPPSPAGGWATGWRRRGMHLQTLASHLTAAQPQLRTMVWHGAKPKFHYAPTAGEWYRHLKLRRVATTSTDGYRVTVQYEYDTTSGALERVVNANDQSQAYWEAPKAGAVPPMDAAGHIQGYTLGNGIGTVRDYDPQTGELTGISSGRGVTDSSVQLLTYQYDAVGNLKERHDANQSLTEDFSYDALNRLTASTLTAGGTTAQNLSLTYDAIGDITSKTGAGTYTYDPSHPHAVASVTGSVNTTYSYDADGNMIQGNGKSYGWTAFNKPFEIVSGSEKSDFWYAPDRSLYQQVATASDGTQTTTDYVAGGLFRLISQGSLTTYKYYIPADGQFIAVETQRTNNTQDLRYLHYDNLGSLDTITDETGQVIARLSFDAFGRRRDAGNWSGSPSNLGTVTGITALGFTGHEELDNVGLIHMGGRVYDP